MIKIDSFQRRDQCLAVRAVYAIFSLIYGILLIYIPVDTYQNSGQISKPPEIFTIKENWQNPMIKQIISWPYQVECPSNSFSVFYYEILTNQYKNGCYCYDGSISLNQCCTKGDNCCDGISSDFSDFKAYLKNWSLQGEQIKLCAKTYSSGTNFIDCGDQRVSQVCSYQFGNVCVNNADPCPVQDLYFGYEPRFPGDTEVVQLRGKEKVFFSRQTLQDSDQADMPLSKFKVSVGSNVCQKGAAEICWSQKGTYPLLQQKIDCEQCIYDPKFKKFAEIRLHQFFSLNGIIQEASLVNIENYIPQDLEVSAFYSQYIPYFCQDTDKNNFFNLFDQVNSRGKLTVAIVIGSILGGYFLAFEWWLGFCVRCCCKENLANYYGTTCDCFSGQGALAAIGQTFLWIFKMTMQILILAFSAAHINGLTQSYDQINTEWQRNCFEPDYQAAFKRGFSNMNEGLDPLKFLIFLIVFSIFTDPNLTFLLRTCFVRHYYPSQIFVKEKQKEQEFQLVFNNSFNNNNPNYHPDTFNNNDVNPKNFQNNQITNQKSNNLNLEDLNFNQTIVQNIDVYQFYGLQKPQGIEFD